MLIMAIADVPAQMATFHGWFLSFAPHLHTMTARWILGGVGILISLSPWLSWWAKPMVNVEIKPINGAGTSAVIIVRNKGSVRQFSVQCELLALRNSPNKLRQECFTLKWVDSGEQWITLAQGQSSKAIIATWEIDHKEGFASLSVVELADKALNRVEWAGWSAISTERVPEYDLKITVLGAGTRRGYASEYTLRPETWHGPLEIVSLEKASA